MAQLPDAAGAQPAPFVLTAAEQSKDATAVTAEELRNQLQGKTFYLRGGYLDNKLHFDEHGRLAGGSTQASFTLSMVEIGRVRLEKRRLVLEGVRYGLHFLGALPTEDQTQAVDKVRLTSKKKPLEIVMDRELVVKPKKQKRRKDAARPGAQTAALVGQSTNSTEQPTEAAAGQIFLQTDRNAAVATTSQTQANRALMRALDLLFAATIDDRMVATLPDYWQRFYRGAAEHRDSRPDAGVLRQSEVDEKAKLISALEPPSNEFAQENGVAGMAMYHVVVGADGKPQEIAVGRPIGFGLDENAIESIRRASFQPAMKNGRPVPVMVDLVVEFRIYSKRTALAANEIGTGATLSAQPKLPGPYSVNQTRDSGQPH